MGIARIKCMFLVAVFKISRPPSGLRYSKMEFKCFRFQSVMAAQAHTLSPCTRCKDTISELSEPGESNTQTAVSCSDITGLNNIAFLAWASPEGWNPGGAVRACRTSHDKGTALTKHHGSCHVCCKTCPEQYVVLVSNPFPSSLIPVGSLVGFFHSFPECLLTYISFYSLC